MHLGIREAARDCRLEIEGRNVRRCASARQRMHRAQRMRSATRVSASFRSRARLAERAKTCGQATFGSMVGGAIDDGTSRAAFCVAPMRNVRASSRFTASSLLALIAFACGLAMLLHCDGTDQASIAGSDGGDAGGDAVDAGDEREGGPVSYDDGGPPPGQLIAVNAAPELFTFRLCLRSERSEFSYGLPPWPYAGAVDGSANLSAIPAGQGAVLPPEIVPSLPLGGGSLILVAYLIDASALAASANPNASCTDLVGPQCPGRPSCLKATDYSVVHSDTWFGSGPTILAVVWCTYPECGFTGPSLKLVWVGNPSMPNVGQIGVKLADVSRAAGSVVAFLDSSDAGAIALDAASNYGAPDKGALVMLPSSPTSPEWESQGIAIELSDGGMHMSLADLQRVSAPASTPSSFFRAGGSFAFVLVGDPAATNRLYVDGGLNPAFDGRALHFVAFRTSP